MSGDYETLEINQPKITYFKKRAENNTLESFFECITSCSINSEGVDCTTACYVKHLEPNNIDYPLKFS